MRGIDRLLGTMTSVVFLLGLMVVPVAAQSEPDGQHCPAHDATYVTPHGKHGTSGDLNVDGVTISWSGASVSIENTNEGEASVVWCAKGGAGFDGGSDPIESQSSGEQTAVLGADETFSSTYGTGISYFMLYSVVVAEGEEDEQPQPEEPIGEGCPTSTQLLVTFSWTGGGYAAEGGNNQGVTVTGDNTIAYWVSAQAISAIVVTAGGETRHITLDFPETTGSISPQNYEVFGGGTITSLGFCVGPKVNPDSGSGASVELVKTAECATVNADGTATVTGQIVVDNHDRRTARITSALDTVLGPNDQALARQTVTALIGVELVEDQAITIDYAVTFDPMGFEGFDNFIEVTIERADTGEARHKIYNDRAPFVLCEQPERPVEEQGQLTILKFSCEGETVGVAFFVNDPAVPTEGCDESDAVLMLHPVGTEITVTNGTAQLTVDAGVDYQLEETAPNTGRSQEFAVEAAGETVVVVINFFAEDEQPGVGGPDEEEEEDEEEAVEKPREDQLGGMLPDTATGPVTGSGPAGLVALVMLTGLGAAGYAMEAARRRR